jgi:anti-sigma factor RsiW
VTCEDVGLALDAYMDDECDGDTTTAIRRHVAGCAICRERLAQYETVGRLVRLAPYYPAPDRLRQRVADAIADSRRRWHVATWAAAAAVAIAIGGGLVSLRSVQKVGAASDAIVDEVVTDHVRSLMADHLFDVRSTDQHTVKPWFLGKLDYSPPVEDLTPVGFPLVGGRLDSVAGRAVAALIYQRHQHVINVFVWPAADAPTLIDSRSIRGFHVRQWTRDGMSFWAVSDLNDPELAGFAQALQQ